MNKLAWFTHDNDAHDDEFIQASWDKFGPAGYAWYFILLELLHRHGNGNVLKISRSRLCRKLRGSWARVQSYLNFGQTSAKFKLNSNSTEVELHIQKFLERQRKLRFNRSSTVPQPFLNRSVYNKEKDNIKENIKKDFEIFWQTYPDSPHKQPRLRQVSWKVWSGLKPNRELAEAILRALEAQKQTPSWQADGGKYIPTPNKWLKERRWEDKIHVKKAEPLDDDPYKGLRKEHEGS